MWREEGGEEAQEGRCAHRALFLVVRMGLKKGDSMAEEYEDRSEEMEYNRKVAEANRRDAERDARLAAERELLFARFEKTGRWSDNNEADEVFKAFDGINELLAPFGCLSDIAATLVLAAAVNRVAKAIEFH